MQQTLKNRTIFCKDNLDILRGIDTDTIDLIYLDPPFNKKKIFAAPMGSSAAGASFADIFRKEDIKDDWVRTIQEDHYTTHELLNAVKSIESRASYNYCYLCYMAIRLIECHRILKHTGSVYLHCDPTMSHHLKLLLDCIFGEEQFRNEIIWGYRTGGVSKRYLPRKHDIILYYGKTEKTLHHPLDENGKYPVEEYVRDVWDDEIKPIINVSKARTGYPTQKPIALLERIISISSNEGDTVLDPFCGCATACVAAEKLKRQWIGIDISIEAYNLVRKRLTEEVANPESLFDWHKEITFSTEPPKRTDGETDGAAESADQKHVYLISHPNYPGEYKVGIATNAKQRLNAYQTSDPNRAYKLEHSLLTGHYRALERHIHERFENKHEWVRAKKEDIIAAMGEYTPH